MLVKEFRVILHFYGNLESCLQVAIEIDQVWIGIVEKSFARLQAQRDRKSAAKRFYQFLLGMGLVEFAQMRNEPPFATGPFEGKRFAEWARWLTFLNRKDFSRP